MKKKIAALVASCALALAVSMLTACSSTEENVDAILT